MSRQIQVTISILIALSICLVVSAFVWSWYSNNYQKNNSNNQNPIKCLQPGECEYYSCDEKIVYGDNCTTKIEKGFCCNSYSSLTDICMRNDFCNGSKQSNLCETAGQTIKSCDRCISGKSSSIKITQGDNGCIYTPDVCKPDSECGEIKVPDKNNVIKEDETKCSDDDWEVGEERKECCDGKDIGKSRIIKKGENCTFTVIQKCIKDAICETGSEQSTTTTGTGSTANAPLPIGATPVPTTKSTSTNTNSTSSNQNNSNNTSTNTNPSVTTLPSNTVSPTTTGTPSNGNTSSENGSDPSPTIAENSAGNSWATPGASELPEESETPTITPVASPKKPKPPVKKLPTTSLEYTQITMLALGIVVMLAGIKIYQNEQLQDKMERLLFSITQPIHQGNEEAFKKRSKKRFEKRVEGK